MVNDRTGQDGGGLSKHVMEINPNHGIIVNLNSLREVNDALAKKVARQVRIAVTLFHFGHCANLFVSFCLLT